MREQGGGGPSAMDLYGRHSGSADLGGAKAAMLDAYTMEQQQKYAVPIGGARMRQPENAPSWYNYDGLQPAKYDLPSAAKERLMAKQAVRDAVPRENPGVMRTDPITDYEVDYVQAMKRQAKLASFDRYVQTLVDPKKPGNLKWLMEVYPEFVHRRIAQVHDDYDFAIRNQMIDNWGINTLDDLHFKYLVDQGQISGSKLGKRVPTDIMYRVGILAPYRNTALAGQTREDDGSIALPYASERPANSGWRQSGRGQPLGGGDRDLESLARSLYARPSDAPGVEETQSLERTGNLGARI